MGVQVVGRYVRTQYRKVRVPSDTLRTWKWSPTLEIISRYMSLLTPEGPGSGPEPPKMLASIK